MAITNGSIGSILTRLGVGVVLIATAALSQTIFIETIAGVAGFDNLPARQTPLIVPEAVWITPGGDLYVAENFVVRRIRNGTSTIVAGGGTIVDDSLPIPGTKAVFDFPIDLAGAPTGEIYIADVNHNRIRRLNTDGSLTTVVGRGTAGYSGDGGRGSFAELSAPTAIAVSASGDLYIADDGNAVVRKFDTHSGVITTIAGTGQPGDSGDGGPALSAQLGYISALAVDALGNLYLADSFSYVVRKITPSGIISTFAGNGTPGFSGDGGPARSAAIGVVDGLTVDASGSLYICDIQNLRIRVVATNGTISTYAGQSNTNNFGAENVQAAQVYLRAPGHPAIDAAGNLYFPEAGGGLVRRIDARTKILTTVAGTTEVYDGSADLTAPINPSDVTADAQGNVYVADYYHFRVRRIDSTGRISTVAGDGIQSGAVGSTSRSIGYAAGVSADPFNGLLIADSAAGVVRRLDFATGIVSTLVDLSTYRTLNKPRPVAAIADSFANVYISDQGNNQIWVYFPSTRQLLPLAGTGSPGYAGDGGPSYLATINGPQGLAIDSQNRLLICDTFNHVVRSVDLFTLIIGTFAGNGLAGPAFDGFPATSTSLTTPFGLAVSGDYVFISDNGLEKILFVSPDGTIGTFAGGDLGLAGDGQPAVFAKFFGPQGIAFANTQLFVADTLNHRVRHLFIKDVSNALVADPPSLSFRLPQGGIDGAIQLLTFKPSLIGLNIPYTISGTTVSGGQWLYACPLASLNCQFQSTTPDTVAIAVDTSNLAPGAYQAVISAVSPGVPNVSIPLQLTVDPPNIASAVKLSPEVMRLTAASGGRATQQLAVTSPGQNALNWTVQPAAGSPWLSFSAGSGTTPGVVNVSVDATNLAPGSYSALAYFAVNGGGPTLFAVTVTVTQAQPTLQLDRDSLLFQTVEGSTAIAPQVVGVFNPGSGPLNWELVIPPGVSWIRTSQTKGVAQAGAAPSSTTVLLDPTDPGVRRAGDYYAALTVQAAGATGSPQVIGVRLRVSPAGSGAGPVLDRTALVFSGPPGASIPSQSVSLSSTGGALNFSSSVRTADGGQWLSVSQTSGTLLSSADRAVVSYSVAPRGLAEGLYSGTVTYTFSDGSVYAVNVRLILRTGAVTSQRAPALVRPRAAACSPTRQVLISPAILNNFTLSAGWPIPMEAQVVDDCGGISVDSTVIASFSNGDPAMALTNLRNGRYTGTWTPVSSANSVNITMQALHPTLAADQAQVTGRVSNTGSPVPILFSNGVVNDASRRKASVVSPGGRLALQGANFPSSGAGVTVLVGSSVAKIVSVAANEIQIVAPQQFDSTQALVLVSAGSFVTAPAPVSVVGADPGLYPLPDGTTVPAGSTLTLTATGLGATGADGAAILTPTATLGSQTLPVQSAVSSGAGDGLFKVTVAIPPDATGPAALSIQQGGATSNAVTVTLQ